MTAQCTDTTTALGTYAAAQFTKAVNAAGTWATFPSYDTKGNVLRGFSDARAVLLAAWTVTTNGTDSIHEFAANLGIDLDSITAIESATAAAKNYETRQTLLATIKNA